VTCGLDRGGFQKKFGEGQPWKNPINRVKTHCLFWFFFFQNGIFFSFFYKAKRFG
jgi:hypothetical protein